MEHTVLVMKRKATYLRRCKPKLFLHDRVIAYYLLYIHSALRMGPREEPADTAETRRDIIRTGHAALRRRALPCLRRSYRRSRRRAALDHPWDGATRCGRCHPVSGCTRVPGG